jgi:hypothetical protein
MSALLLGASGIRLSELHQPQTLHVNAPQSALKKQRDERVRLKEFPSHNYDPDKIVEGSTD